MELQRFYTGYVSSAIPPHRYPQVYNIRIGGKRRRRRASVSDGSDGPYSRQTQIGKPSKSSPLAQIHSVSFLELDIGEDHGMAKETSAKSRGIESDLVLLKNPWPESSEKSQPSYDRTISSPNSQTEPRGQVSVSYLPFQSCSDLSSTLVDSDPLEPPGLGEAASTILQLCNELEQIANGVLPNQNHSKSSKSQSNDSSSRDCISETLAESLLDVSIPSLFDGDPFAELPPGNGDTSDSARLVAV